MRIINWNKLSPIKNNKQYNFKYAEIYHIKFITLQNKCINKFNIICTGKQCYYYSYNNNLHDLKNMNIVNICILNCIFLKMPNKCLCLFRNDYYVLYILLGTLSTDQYITESNIRNAPVEETIRFLLTDNEQHEIYNIYSIIIAPYVWLNNYNWIIDSYILKLSQKKHDTFEYKRYKKICKCVSASLREQIENRIKSVKTKRIIFISLSALVILLVVGITIKCAVGNNSKDAQSNDEKQRVEKYEGKSGLKKIE